MSQFTMQQVKELRERTQAGLNDCKIALTETNGDMEAAVEVILKKGLAKSAKRAGALTTEGVVAARVAPDGRAGVLVEVNIQTDFAARNEDFLKFVDDAVAVALNAVAGEDLATKPCPGSTESLEERRQKLVARLGENITVRRWHRLDVKEAGLVHAYIHLGGKIGALLAVQTGAPTKSEELTRFVDETAMQVAAMTPLFLNSAAVPEDAKQKQREIFNAQLAEEGKPEAARPKIVEGKVAKWLKEVCLLEQQSVIDSDKTVEQVRAGVEKALGTPLKVSDFVRFERGEGLVAEAKPSFADEARRMAGQA
jgi:elongation factor Ts